MAWQSFTDQFTAESKDYIWKRGSKLYKGANCREYCHEQCLTHAHCARLSLYNNAGLVVKEIRYANCQDCQEIASIKVSSDL